MADSTVKGIVATRRDDTVASIARQAPAMTQAQRARLAALLKPAAQR